MIDLSVRIGSLTLPNPVMPGSGTFADSMAQVIDIDRLGALVTKTITPEIRSGNPQPRVTEVVGGMLSSIGIPSKGADHYVNEVVPLYAGCRPDDIPARPAGDHDAIALLHHSPGHDLAETGHHRPT